MTDRAALLDYADQVLDGTFGLHARAPRVAAVLARCALEDWLDDQNAEWCSAASGSGPTTVSKLVVLGTRHGAQVGEQAKRAWQGLSLAVHHHSYELAPSTTEVRHLVEQVRALDAATRGSISSSSDSVRPVNDQAACVGSSRDRCSA